MCKMITTFTYIQSVQAKIYNIGMKLVLWKNCIVDKHKIKPYGVWWWMVGGKCREISQSPHKSRQCKASTRLCVPL